LRQCFIGRGEITIVNMPELNLLDAFREFSFQNRKVLGPIDRYNVVRACQIAFVEGARAANFAYKRDTARGQPR
jgi:hypothetical protein